MIANILVDSFGARCDVSAMSQDDHRVHLEGFPPSSWQTTPCKRASGKAE